MCGQINHAQLALWLNTNRLPSVRCRVSSVLFVPACVITANVDQLFSVAHTHRCQNTITDDDNAFICHTDLTLSCLFAGSRCYLTNRTNRSWRYFIPGLSCLHFCLNLDVNMFLFYRLSDILTICKCVCIASLPLCDSAIQTHILLVEKLNNANAV